MWIKSQSAELTSKIACSSTVYPHITFGEEPTRELSRLRYDRPSVAAKPLTSEGLTGLRPLLYESVLPEPAPGDAFGRLALYVHRVVELPQRLRIEPR